MDKKIDALVVDDNRINLMFLEEMLSGCGVTVHTAESGAEALALAITGTCPFDAVFLDYLMPDMDGMETCRGLRAVSGFEDIPVFMVTADDSERVRELSRAAGVTDCLVKPVEPDTLDAVLSKWLGVQAGVRADEGGRIEWFDALGGVEGLDAGQGLALVKGNHGAYEKLLKAFCRQIEQKEGQMAAYLSEGDRGAYAIEIHSVKSSLNIIGAGALAGRAKALELAAGGGGGLEDHAAFMGEAVRLGARIRAVLEPFSGSEEGKPPGRPEDLMKALEDALAAVDEFETGEAAEIIRAARGFRYDLGDCDQRLEALENRLDDYDYGGFVQGAAELLSHLRQGGI